MLQTSTAKVAVVKPEIESKWQQLWIEVTAICTLEADGVMIVATMSIIREETTISTRLSTSTINHLSCGIFRRMAVLLPQYHGFDILGFSSMACGY